MVTSNSTPISPLSRLWINLQLRLWSVLRTIKHLLISGIIIRLSIIRIRSQSRCDEYKKGWCERGDKIRSEQRRVVAIRNDLKERDNGIQGQDRGINQSVG